MLPPRSPADDRSRARALTVAARTLATLAGVFALLVLAGWIFDIAALRGRTTGPTSMKANAAVLFVCAALATLLLIRRRDRPVRLLGGFMVLVSVLTVSQTIFGVNAGIDELIVRDHLTEPPLVPGRMVLATTIGLSGLGVALIASTMPRGRRLAHGLMTALLLLSSTAVLGYLFDVNTFANLGAFATVALRVALLLNMLALAILFTHTEIGLVRLFLSDMLTGAFVRRLLPTAVGAPVVIGFLWFTAESRANLSREFGLALMVMLMVLTITGVIWRSAYAIEREERVRGAVQHALRERQAATAALLDNALDAVVSIDPASRVTYWNHRAEVVFGWTAEDAMGRDLATLLMPERYRASHRAGLERFLTTGEGPILGTRVELTALRRDGSELDIELAVVTTGEGATRAFHGFIADITARKQAEEALRVSEQHKASLLRISRALEQADTFDRVLEAALAEVRAIMGYERVWAYLAEPDGASASLITIQGAHAAELGAQYPRLRITGDALMEAIFATDQPVVVADARIDPRTDKVIVEALGNRTIVNVRMSLADRHIGAFGTGSFGDEGVRVPDHRQLEFFASMASDVAIALDRVQLTIDRARALDYVKQLNTVLEERVAVRTAELEASNREFEAFSYSVSHDLRAPLRHITGFAKLVQVEHGAALSSEGHRYLSIIRDSAQNMGRMIDDLLEMGRLDRQLLTRTAVDLGAVVRDTIAELQLDTSDRVIEWRVGALPVVHCDRGLVKLVFANLLGNAVKYTRTRPAAAIRVEEARPGVFVIADNGVGFDQRYAHKLFGVFQRLHHGEDFEGTGIGLATVARIVHKHGGRIWAEGEMDRGATFSFTLAPEAGSGDQPEAGEGA